MKDQSPIIADLVNNPWNVWLSPYQGLSTDRFSWYSPLMLVLVSILVVLCCITYAWIHQRIYQLMFIATDSSHLNQVFTRRNEPFNLESVVEILRFLMKFTVFCIRLKTENFMKKRRIQPRGRREKFSAFQLNSPFFYKRQKTEIFIDKTENFTTQIVRSTE